MPSTSGIEISYTVHSRRPLSHVPSQVLECVCFVCKLRIGHTKLSLKSFKCIVLWLYRNPEKVLILLPASSCHLYIYAFFDNMSTLLMTLSHSESRGFFISTFNSGQFTNYNFLNHNHCLIPIPQVTDATRNAKFRMQIQMTVHSTHNQTPGPHVQLFSYIQLIH